jgi:hypothetical protein
MEQIAKLTPVDPTHIGPSEAPASAEVLGRINTIEQHINGPTDGVHRNHPPDCRAIVWHYADSQGRQSNQALLNMRVTSSFSCQNCGPNFVASSFQYEFIIVHMPPPKPDLRIVK